MLRWLKFLGCLLILGVLAGCQKTASPKTKQATITIMAPYLSGPAPTSRSQVMQRLEKMTHTNLKVQWVSNEAYTDKVNVTMAANKLPDIIVFKDKDATFIKDAQNGDFWNLTKYLKDYPNLSQANPQVLRNASINGQVYGIYRSRDIMRASVTLRQDWLKRLKLKTPTNLTQLTAVMQAFTKDDPDGDGKNDTYGMILNKWYGFNNGAPWEIVATWLGAPNGWGERQDGSLYPAFMSPAYLKSLKWFRQAIKAGYINPDFATSTDNLTESFLAGKGGSFIQPAYMMADISEQTSNTDLLKCYAFTGNLKANATATPRAWATNGYSGLLAIPKSSVKTPGELKRVLQFIDQTESKAGQVLMNNGIQGKNFQVDTKDAQYASPINQKSATYRQIVTDTAAISQLKTGVNEKNQPYRVVPQPLQGLADRRYQIMSRDERHAIYNEAAPYVSKTYSKNGAVLDNIITTAEIQYMAGEIDDQGWQQAIDKWLKAGGQQVIKEYSTLNRQKNK